MPQRFPIWAHCKTGLRTNPVLHGRGTSCHALALTETLTDNIDLTTTDKQSGLISQLSPGIRIDARTARLKMFLDYQLNAIAYSTGNNGNQVQNELNAFGTLEAIDNWLFLDFGGQITQQVINQFGQQSSSNVYNTGNTTETSTFFISPFIRGQLGGSADYFLRYNTSVTNSTGQYTFRRHDFPVAGTNQRKHEIPEPQLGHRWQPAKHQLQPGA